MSNNTNTSSGGIGFLTLLTLLFIGLKLGGVIEWEWFWVVSPIIVQWLLVLGVILPTYLTYMYFKEKEPYWLIFTALTAAITWGLNYGLYILIG